MEKENLSIKDFIVNKRFSKFLILLLQQNEEFLKEIIENQKQASVNKMPFYQKTLFVETVLNYQDLDLIKFLLESGCSPKDLEYGEGIDFICLFVH